MSKRVYLTAHDVGTNFGTVGNVRLFHPGCPDHGEVLCETNTKPHGFRTAALNAATDLALNRGYTIVDDYQP